MNLQEFWNGFKQNKIAVNTRMQQEYNRFLQLFDREGLKRSDPPINNWPLFENETTMVYDGCLYAGKADSCKEVGYEIILFDQLQGMINEMFDLARTIKSYCDGRRCTSCIFYCDCECECGVGNPNDWDLSSQKEYAPKLRAEEKENLKKVGEKYKWLTCDKNGVVYAHANKPLRDDGLGVWYDRDDNSLFIVNKAVGSTLFAWCKWEDEPWYIPDLLA